MNDDDIDAFLRVADIEGSTEGNTEGSTEANADAPQAFEARVMQRIAGLPLPRPPPRWRTLAQGLAIALAGALGASQVVAFIFGLWAVTAAAAA